MKYLCGPRVELPSQSLTENGEINIPDFWFHQHQANQHAHIVLSTTVDSLLPVLYRTGKSRTVKTGMVNLRG